MPSPIGHMLAGAAAGLAIAGPVRPSAIVLFAAAGAIPDADLIYGLHRGPSHSIGAAAIAGAVGWFLWRPLDPTGRSGVSRARFAVALAAAYATHIVTDVVSHDTLPPLGVMALWPISTEFYQAPFHIFLPINRRYWLLRAWLGNFRAVIRELLILGPLVWIAWFVRSSVGRRPPRLFQ
jgi:membrane-bound metal-dependent hydrolase YbcI (DUF457 family)